MHEDKPKTDLYLKVVQIFLDRMLVKKIIPIDYENALNEVVLDMTNMFEDDENKADLKELKDEIAVLKSFQDKLSSLWFDIENRVCVVQNTDFEYRKSWNITLIEEEHTADLSNLSLFMPYLAKSISTDLPYNFGINLNFLESTEFRYESFKNAMIHV